MKIHRYKLKNDGHNEVSLPISSKILNVIMWESSPTLLVLVDPTERMKKVFVFDLIIDDYKSKATTIDDDSGEYVGTFTRYADTQFVHVFNKGE